MFGAFQVVRPRVSRRRVARRGFSLTWVAVPLGVVAAVSALFATKWFGTTTAPIIDDSLVYRVTKNTFAHSVTEPGELESSDNVEVKCEVKARGNSQGMKILWIIEPGALVKPGDLLVKFDASSLQDERAQQEITFNNSEALVVQSRNVYETAEIAKKEYLNGTFMQEEQVVQGEIFVAEENLRSAQQFAEYSQRLAAKGYVTTLQLEGDRFKVAKARKDLQAAQTKLNVLQNFTQAKMLKTLESDIQTAKAKLTAAENAFKIDSDKLKFLEDQLSKCEIRAPKPGKVVYANRIGGRDDREVIIEEGAIIREGQPVIRLPDLQKMQVMARINESKIAFIRTGMKATVRLDAFRDAPLAGTVVRVDEYPVPPSWMSSNIKQYATYVQIHDSTPGIRPGLTAQVEIHIDSIPNVVSVPVQAVIEREKQHYCLVKTANELEVRPVTIGPTNNAYVVVEKGLNADELIVLDANNHLADVRLPEAPPGSESVAGEGRGRRNRDNGDQASEGGPPGNVAQAGGDPSEGGQRRRGGGGGGGRGRRDPAAMVDGLLQRFDADHDESLSESEIPAEQRTQLADADANHDGKIDRAELTASVTKQLASRQRGPGPEGPQQ